MASKKILFCDFNGTLLDDTPLWYQVVRELFELYGVNPPTIEEYFLELQGDYLEIYRRRGIDISRKDLNALYIPRYEVLLPQTKLAPNAAALLETLNMRGVLLALVTGQHEPLVTPLLTRFGIERFFSHFFFHTTDKAKAIRDIRKRDRIPAARCYFVGDTPSDIAQAKCAGVMSIAFINKTLPEESRIPEDLIKSAEPDFVVYDLLEIVSIME